jgi:hypothetical protein
VKPFLTLSAILVWFVANSQVSVNENSRLYSLPGNSDSIQKKLSIDRTGEEPGPKKGANADFFKLYNVNNDSLDIALELSKGKPVFMFGGSYTCPNFRRQVGFFDSLALAYKNKVSFYMIYIIEAHPHYPDLSPYSEQQSIKSKNIKDSIFYRQPKVYAQRKIMAQTMIDKTGLKTPVFIDNTSNQWLSTYGTMPYMAYLIDTNGKVVSKFLEYDQSKKEIIRDLKQISQKNQKNLTKGE